MELRLTHDCLLRAVTGALLSAGIAAFSTAALAGNVDYEDQPLGAVLPNTPLVFDHPLYVQALDDSDIADGVACAPNCPSNGSKYQLSYGSGFAGAVTISGEPIPVSCDPDCSPFDLFEIDVAEPLPGTGPISLIIYGYPVDAAALDLAFVTDGIVDGTGGEADFETIVLPDTFRNLSSVVIIAAAPYLGVAIDNIVVEPEIQPAPALAPLGLGVLALAMCASAAWFGRERTTTR